MTCLAGAAAASGPSWRCRTLAPPPLRAIPAAIAPPTNSSLPGPLLHPPSTHLQLRPAIPHRSPLALTTNASPPLLLSCPHSTHLQYYDLPSVSIRNGLWPLMQAGLPGFRVDKARRDDFASFGSAQILLEGVAA